MLEDDIDPFGNNDEVDPLLHDILIASKLKPLGDEVKKYCRKGHLLECPVLEQFREHCLDKNINTRGYKSVARHETPVNKCCLCLCLYLYLYLYCINLI